MNKQQLKKKTRSELLALASDLAIANRHKMDKELLIDRITKAGRNTKAKKKTALSKPPDRKKPESKKKKPAIKKKLPAKKIITPAEQLPAHDTIPAKDFLLEATNDAAAGLQELPRHYGETRITLIARDPWWAYAYWEISPQELRDARHAIGKKFHEAKATLRVYDITGITFDGTNAHQFFDIEIIGMAQNWYINVGTPGRAYCVEIGLKSEPDDFFPIARSNTIFTPPARISERTEEYWMSPDEIAESADLLESLRQKKPRFPQDGTHETPSGGVLDSVSPAPDIYAPAGMDREGHKPARADDIFIKKVYAASSWHQAQASSPGIPGMEYWKDVWPSAQQEILAKRLQEQISSPGVSSEAMPQRGIGRMFWLTLDAELIVYGATEPDATVYMQGKPIALRPDGTFSIRCALPDGTRIIPVVAESSDGTETRTIIPTVSRATERPRPKYKK